MSNRHLDFKDISERLQEKYKGVRVLPACIAIESDRGSIVIYRLRTWFTICQGDKRIECEPDEVDNEVAKLM